MTAAVDIRAQTFCSLGTIISGNLADTYAQGSGLITTRGSVELDGIYSPPVGTRVEFGYAKGGFVARLPRTVRVLSSFADPFRRKTTVQLGCLLTFLESRKPPVEDPSSRDENDVECKVYDKAILPISAKYVVEQILSTLDIKSDTVPLTNYFSVEKFDLSPGFIQVLGDLLVSEGYIGYLNEAEKLKFKDLSDKVNKGPVLDSRNIIDINPIGVGDLPGDAVIVNYSSLRLKPPDELEDEETRAKRNWEWEEVFGAQKEVSITYINDLPPGSEGESVTVIGYYYPYNFSATTYDSWDRAVERLSYEQSSIAEVNGRWASDKYKFQSQIGGNEFFTYPAGRMQYTKWTYKVQAPPNYSSTYNIRSDFWDGGSLDVKALFAVVGAAETGPASECYQEPPEGYEEILQEETLSFISEAEVAGTLNLDTYTYVDGGALYKVLDFSTAYTDLESSTTTTYEKDLASGITKTKTETILMYGKTTTGQQDLATLIQTPPDFGVYGDYADWVNGLVFQAKLPRTQGIELRIRTEREYGLQRRPSQEERNNTANAKPEVTEQKAEVTWVTGGTESTNYIEFSMPYAPDDRISWTELGGYTSTPSDAGAKALRFGRIQNRLLLGNRNGISIQIPAELMPPRPFDPLYVEADNLTAQYRVNAATYSFDSNGIVASADCLFWGGVG